MNEEIEYAEMLEIPVSTVNVVRKKRRKKADSPVEPLPGASGLKASVIASVNGRLDEEAPSPAQPDGADPLLTEAEGSRGEVDFDPVPERIDTVRLYSADGEDGALHGYDFTLNEGGMYKTKPTAPKKVRIALGVELGVACALCCGIFLTNVFMPNSAINTFFRAMGTPTETVAEEKPYTDFALSAVVSELSEAKLNLSPSGVLSFTDACHVYPAADGTVREVTKNEAGLYTVKINYTNSFTGIINGLDRVYYAVGDSVKSRVPVGFTEGETEVQVTMYSDGVLLNCFELTEENCLAWISDAE